jgi:hypothetical protein
MRCVDEQRPPEPLEEGPAATGDQPLPAPPATSARPWEPVAAETAPRVTADRRRAGKLTVAGGLLVLGCQFLPWLSASGPGGALKGTGIDLHNWGLMLLGGFAVARGATMIQPERFRFNLGTPLIGGAILVFLLVSRYNDLQSSFEQLEAEFPGVNLSIGIGFWGAALGTAMVIAGGVLALRRD